MEYFFKTDMIDLLVDFVFGEKKQGDIQMGNTYSQPCLTPLTKVISNMMSQKDMVEKYDKKKLVGMLMTKQAFLKKYIEENISHENFQEMLDELCRENYTLTKKMSKIFLKAFGSTQNIEIYLKALKKFLLIKDSLQV